MSARSPFPIAGTDVAGAAGDPLVRGMSFNATAAAGAATAGVVPMASSAGDGAGPPVHAAAKLAPRISAASVLMRRC